MVLEGVTFKTPVAIFKTFFSSHCLCLSSHFLRFSPLVFSLCALRTCGSRTQDYHETTQLLFRGYCSVLGTDTGSRLSVRGDCPYLVFVWKWRSGYEMIVRPLEVATSCWRLLAAGESLETFLARLLEQYLWRHIRWRRPSECACAPLVLPRLGLLFLQDVSLVDG